MLSPIVMNTRLLRQPTGLRTKHVAAGIGVVLLSMAFNIAMRASDHEPDGATLDSPRPACQSQAPERHKEYDPCPALACR